MQNAVLLAKKMAKQLDKNWLPELEEINLHSLFHPIYKLSSNIVTLNSIVAFIIMAYDSESHWIDLKQNRLDNKLEILKTLEADISDSNIQCVLYLETNDMQEVVGAYLKRQQDWKFKTIITCFDYHSKHIQSATEPTTVTDELEKSKINKSKGELLQSAIKQREIGEQLLLEIKKDYVKLDHITQSEFGFTASDIERVDCMSWRSFIRNLKNNKINS